MPELQKFGFSLARGLAQQFSGGLCWLSSPWGDTWLFFGTGDKQAAAYMQKASEGIICLCRAGVQGSVREAGCRQAVLLSVWHMP